VASTGARAAQREARMRHAPLQKPGRSKQDYGTPWEFVHAVESEFGRINIDLAAREDNKKAPICVTPERDTLTVDWSAEFQGMLGWLNPEFADMSAYARKCVLHGGKNAFRVIMLSPASVSTEWFAEHVHGKAAVLAVRPRLCFEGCEAPYPKDLMLTLFGFGHVGFDLWKWK
jgi:phage N-6-adenine-methyltransferase